MRGRGRWARKDEGFMVILLNFREEVARELKSALSSIKLSERGVFVQASTLGSLEALLEFLKGSKIPVSGEWDGNRWECSSIIRGLIDRKVEVHLFFYYQSNFDSQPHKFSNNNPQWGNPICRLNGGQIMIIISPLSLRSGEGSGTYKSYSTNSINYTD